MARGWQFLAVYFFALCARPGSAQNAQGQSKPLSIPPSQFWDGEDGPWSTFRIEVGGDSPQQVRVLPASGQSSTLLVIPEACDRMWGANLVNCNNVRGGLYKRNESRTWNEYGQYNLNNYVEGPVGFEGDGLYGYDTLSLGWTGDGAPTLKNQSVAGVISPNLTLGSIALNSRPVNFSNYNNPVPSLLHNLRNTSTPIPSLSWSYTAGGYNLIPKVFGSLVLGGYDKNRFTPNNLSFPFGKDDSLDLQLTVQSISTNVTDKPLLSTAFLAHISTLAPDIWLPSDAADSFAKAFNFSYDSTNNYFYVEQAAHRANLARNPEVTFQVGPEVTGASVQLKLPYWNFYMNMMPEFASGRSNVLRVPIMRASQQDQYVLGRTFLQSVYLTTDYERKTFNLSQALHSVAATKENIVAIPSLEQTTSGAGGGSGDSKGGLGTAAIAGIAVGGGVAAVVIGVLLWLLYRQRQNKSKGEQIEDETGDKIEEAPNNATYEMEGYERKYEMQDGEGQKHEVMGDMDPKVELSACTEQQKPAEAANTQVEIYELPAFEHRAAEMEGEGHVKEIG